MRIITSLQEWRYVREGLMKPVGFVPTMGNLHAGHASLLERSRAENQHSVLSIFVNPTQFDEAQDFQRYPRTEAEDIEIAEKCGVDYVLMADQQAFYPDAYTYRIQETSLSNLLCGAHRPGHFIGMLTIVLKLLMLVKADRAYFGEKDFQQLQLVKGLARAFFLDTEIVGCPIVRNEDGLALSSRNSLLSEEQYALAKFFPKLLKASKSVKDISYELKKLGFVVDYVTDYQGRRLGAVRLGAVRLIDNVELETC